MATLKHSRQRDSIREFLMTRTDHPTADVVYHHLRQVYPNISLGTVYRNLSLLADIGEIQKIYTGDGADHFDGQIAPHYHVVCTKCHRVMDLDMEYLSDIEEKAAKHFDGKIQGHTTNFYGVCRTCQDLEKNTENAC
ncbi:MAG: transcriptional repressor [Clostridiales bacterium]|nr:transcriptional repressor [Clostridiales bacterium]